MNLNILRELDWLCTKTSYTLEYISELLRSINIDYDNREPFFKFLQELNEKKDYEKILRIINIVLQDPKIRQFYSQGTNGWNINFEYVSDHVDNLFDILESEGVEIENLQIKNVKSYSKKLIYNNEETQEPEYYEDQIKVIPNNIVRIKSAIPTNQKKRGKSYDTFMSYATTDEKIALDLKSRLETREISCFMAKDDIEAGLKWDDEIRNALKKAKVLLILITPNSKDRPWILIEFGAGWILQKRIIPVTQQIDIKQIQRPLSDYQCRSINIPSDFDTLISEIENIVKEKN